MFENGCSSPFNVQKKPLEQRKEDVWKNGVMMKEKEETQ